MDYFKSKTGKWALITGASSGIGQEFAAQLAELGMNLVLVARRTEKLKQIASKLKEVHAIETELITADLSAGNFLESITRNTNGLEIELLISNAGATIPGSFHKRDLTELNAHLHLNTNAHMQLTHYFGNKMKSRGSGGIILVSSTGAFSAMPYMSNYTAAKAYVLSLGEAMHLELKPYGVCVLVLLPGPTETPMTMEAAGMDSKKLPVTFMPTNTVVRGALKKLGKQAMYIPGAANKFAYLLSKRIFSRLAMAKILGAMMKKAMKPEII